ncbi:MAG: hypothetical protein IVW54_19645 [Candidatus Binataceae bacterium]|nr:hypothetical protein [Candidatus Binataceae bacterium]
MSRKKRTSIADTRRATAFIIASCAIAIAIGYRPGGFVGAGPDPLFAAPIAATPKHSDPNLDAVFAKIPGGNIAPCQAIADPYPEFNGIAVDPVNNLVVMSDDNLKSLIVYDRRSFSADPSLATRPLGIIKGANTYISAAAGVALDPSHHEIYTAENDIGDDVAAFPYTAKGDYRARALAVPHGSYGVAISGKRNELAVSVQQNSQIVIYRLGAKGAQPPRREIRGLKTEMADPHGLAWDDQHDELVVANHGNWSRGFWDVDYNGGGQYRPPSIEAFSAEARGDTAPLRVIQGSATRLNWPFGLSVDPIHNEIAVANAGDHSVLIFARGAHGNAAPIRILKGPKSEIGIPMSVAFDPAHDELWVANLGHTALVFDRTAAGDSAPKRIIRNAPAGTAIANVGIPMSIAYDSKRDQLLVPN